MSGHSKWATIKHKKGAQDKARGKLFAKLIRQVEVAAREGGGDIETNATLRTMYAKARDASVPIDTIDRAVKRGTGELEGVRYEQVNYEGYAPNGVAVYVETLTDNRNRTVGEVRHVLDRHGGNLAQTGAVSHLFSTVGYVAVDRRRVDEDTLMAAALEAGAQDVRTDPDAYEVLTAPGDLEAVAKALEAAGIAVESAEISRLPATTVSLEGSKAQSMLRLMDLLEELDDVQKVYANFDISEAEMAKAE